MTSRASPIAIPGHRHRVGSHVRDQPDVPVGRLDALVQPLGDRHRPLRAEAELAARLLLERRGRERRRGAALLGLGRDRGRPAGAGPRSASAWRSAVSPSPTSSGLAVDPDELRLELVAALGGEERAQGPVLPRDEGVDLALPLDHEADGHGLHPAGGEAAADLARQERAERVADEPVDDPARLLRVDEVGVDRARVARTRP